MSVIRLDNGFADFALLTDRHVMSGVDEIVNDLSKYNSYTYFKAFKRSRNIQGGNGIRDDIELLPDETAEWIGSEHTFTPTSSDGTVTIEAHWARLANHLKWNEEEVENNQGGRGSRLQVYKDVYKSKRLRRRQNTADMLEDSLWATPNQKMEIPIGSTTVGVGDERLPYSIPALLTTDGLAPSQFSTGTILGVSPSVYTNWQNQNTTFTNFANEIEDKLMDMYYLSTWEKAGSPADSTMTANDASGCIMYCDFRSLKELRRILRDSNDRLTSLGQYDKSITYMGRPFEWANPLGNGSIDETNQIIYGVNWDWLTPVIRRNRFMRLFGMPRGGPFIPPLTPSVRILYEYTDVNLFLRSRRRHFVISHANRS